MASSPNPGTMALDQFHGG